MARDLMFQQEIKDTVASELSDLNDAASITRVCVRLLVAAILGGVLGFEREQRGKSAGLRTQLYPPCTIRVQPHFPRSPFTATVIDRPGLA